MDRHAQISEIDAEVAIAAALPLLLREGCASLPAELKQVAWTSI